MGIHFGNPMALFLLACLIPVVLWARRSIAGLGRVRGPLAVALRMVIVVLAVLALARTQWSRTEDDMSVIYVLDQSLSIPADAQQQAQDYVFESQAQRKADDTVGMVLFGRKAALERRPMPTPLLQTRTASENGENQAERLSLQSVVAPERTNIAAGLRLALAAFPASGRKRIVLVSDGNENMDSAADEVDVARRNGVRVDVLPVHYEYSNEVMVEKVVTPAEVERKASFEVRTVVTSYRPAPATLRVQENGGLIASEQVELKEGRNVFVIQRTLPEPGYYSYVATVESPHDTLYANNRGSGFTMVRGRGRVLFVAADPPRAGTIHRALVSQGLDVQLAGLDALPMELGEIIPYDVIILSDVAASSLGEAGMRAVELAVKDWGVGLVMIGGENAFGPGGYQDSPIERALPVTMDIKQRRVMPSGALVVILHTCEIAMGNYWAQQIALAALRVLSPSDEYGILYYDWQGGVKWLFDLQRAQNKSAMAALINSAGPGDMPSFIPAFQMAHASLKKSSASIKHVVVISDGDPAYPQDKEILDMVADGITVSAVGISPHSATDTKRMAYISSIAKGRYYEPQNASALPQIFIKEAATVRRSLIFEETFQPRLALLSEIVKGIESGEYPMLGGYVLTTAKPLSEIPLVTHYKDPLLAHWQYGLGRTVAFTSDAKARWAAEWMGWDKFARFWAQVVRWSARNVQDAGLRVRTEMRDDSARIIVDALDKDGRFMNGIHFTGTMVTPEKNDVPIRLEQTGPGRYEATFDVDEPGTHYMSVRYSDEQGQASLYTHGLVVPYSAEFSELKTDESKLSAMADATGGRVLTPADPVFARTFAAAPRYSETWPLLLLIAVLLVPLDVFARRVFIDYGVLWTKLMMAAAWLPIIGRPYRRRAERPAHISALLSRKKLTRDELDRRARKFAPAISPDVAEETAEDASVLTPGAEAHKPKIAPSVRPELETKGPAITRDDDTYTGRLLRAKRRFREESDASGESPSTDSEKER